MHSRYPIADLSARPDVTLVTGSQRLSRHLLDTYNQIQGATHEVWQAPDLLPFTAFCSRCWQQMQEQLAFAGETPPIQLGQEQAIALWSEIIECSDFAVLLQVRPTAQKALDAWQLLQQYEVSLEALPDTDLDAREFAGWARQFNRQLQERDWLESSQLLSLLTQRLDLIKDDLPRELWLAGFETLTPQQQAFLDALKNLGVTLRDFERSGDDRQLVIDTAPSPEAELRAAARWAEKKLSSGARKIAILVPDLRASKAEFEVILEHQLSPNDWLLPHSGQPWHEVSLGDNLAGEPLVTTALASLRLAAGGLSRGDATGWLLSPFLGDGESEFQARAELDKKLRQFGLDRLTIRELLRIEAEDPKAPLLRRRLQIARECIEDAGKLPPSEWAQLFSDYLDALGWPGQRSLDSREFQLREAFLQLLAQLAGLQLVCKSWSLTEAAQALGQLARAADFHPQTPSAPVQVMGLLEAVGLEFDAVRICGLTDEVLPAPLQANPYIPRAVQRAAGMPGVSADQELKYGRILLANLIDAAPEVVLSHAARRGDEELRPSPLLEELQARDSDNTAVSEADKSSAELQMPPLTDVLFRSRQREVFADDLGLPLAGQRIRGGSGLFKAQANCPIQAYLRYRLSAWPMEEAEAGLDALDRGNLVHLALEFLWRELGSQQRLLELDEAGRAGTVADAIEAAIEKQRRVAPWLHSAEFADIEKHRLQFLLEKLLELESTRPPFTVVALEKVSDLQVGNLAVQTRIDRIDAVEGGHLVIDYKTGKPKLKGIFGARPEEPQLPLYALAERTQVAGVAFMQARADEPKYVGVAEDADVAPGMTAFDGLKDEFPQSLEQALQEWRQILESLAAEFEAGVARVEPQSCQYCHLQPICRIDERLAGAEPGTGEDAS